MTNLVYPWPRAILHIDGDAFFASCEQALHPEYRGKPVITGAERGIAASMSYEAKRAGVTRAMPLSEVKRVCPDCVIVPSDYEAYSLISKRMFDILRTYSPLVEEYSIDEGFVDLTGLRRPLNGSYNEIAEKIKREVESELGISVSVGVSLSKSLAKLASNLNKPGGLTVVSGRDIPHLLAHVAVEEVWGIGSNTSALLRKYGIATAEDFARTQEQWVRRVLTKPGLEIWQELRGMYIYHIDPNKKETYQSISKFKTFTPATSDKQFIFAQLTRNIEKACIKLRRYGLAAKRTTCVLRRQDFTHIGFEIRFSRASSYPTEIVPLIRNAFEKCFQSANLIRQTGVVVHHLESMAQSQYSLFDDGLRSEKIRRVFSAIDSMALKYGKHTLHTAASLIVNNHRQHGDVRGEKTPRQKVAILGERGRQRLNLPYFFVEV